MYLRPFVGQTWAVPEHSERKLATVLFADLAGSTALADDQDPERTRARLERFYDAMASEIHAAGGTIEKFAGDAVMAAFGAPEALEDHAERALHAALSMQRKVESGLALRIGVNTGEVVAATPHAGSSFVSGDAHRRGEREGGRDSLPTGRTCDLADAHARGRRTWTGLRRAERRTAAARVAFQRKVDRSRPVLLTVLGDAGVGKTRLMRELWERLASEEPGPLRLTGRCLAYGEGITFWPFAEILKEHLEILESDPPDEVRRRLGTREILGLTLGLDVVGDLHPLAARDRLHAAWVELFTELASTRPLVVLVEDVHWAEQPLLDLIERIARDVPGPLLLLATARPDFVGGWSPRLDTETILLEPLPPEAAAILVDELLAGDLPREVRDLVVQRA